MVAKNPSLEQLRELVHRGSRDNPHLTSRLEKAAFLLLLRPIVSLGDQRFQVGSEDGLRSYEIVNGHCQCSDYLRHGAGHPCKHRLALSLLHSLNASGERSPHRNSVELGSWPGEDLCSGPNLPYGFRVGSAGKLPDN